MPDEVLRYSVELDPSQLAEQLSQIRAQIDQTLQGVGSAGMGGIGMPIEATAMQNMSMMDQLIARTQQSGKTALETLKNDVLSMRSPGALPTNFAERSALENYLGGTSGFGYDPATSIYSWGEYMRRSRQNTILSVPLIGTEYAGEMHTANFLRDISRGTLGGEMSMDDSRRLSNIVRNIDIDPAMAQFSFSRGEVNKLVSTMAETGAFSSTTNMEEMADRIVSTLGGIRRIQHEFVQAAEEAIQTQATMKMWGIDESGYFLQTGAGRSLGISAQEMLGISKFGGNIAASLGIDPGLGFSSFADQAILLAQTRQGGFIDQWRLNALGGVGGALQSMTQGALGFANSPLGMLTYGTGGGDREAMLAFLNGGLSFSDVIDLKMNANKDAMENPAGTALSRILQHSRLLAPLGVSGEGTLFHLAETDSNFDLNTLYVAMAEGRKASEYTIDDLMAGVYEASRAENDELAPGGLIGFWREEVTPSYRRAKRSVQNVIKRDLRPWLYGKKYDDSDLKAIRMTGGASRTRTRMATAHIQAMRDELWADALGPEKSYRYEYENVTGVMGGLYGIGPTMYTESYDALSPESIEEAFSVRNANLTGYKKDLAELQDKIDSATPLSETALAILNDKRALAGKLENIIKNPLAGIEDPFTKALVIGAKMFHGIDDSPLAMARDYRELQENDPAHFRYVLEQAFGKMNDLDGNTEISAWLSDSSNFNKISLNKDPQWQAILTRKDNIEQVSKIYEELIAQNPELADTVKGQSFLYDDAQTRAIKERLLSNNSDNAIWVRVKKVEDDLSDAFEKTKEGFGG